MLSPDESTAPDPVKVADKVKREFGGLIARKGTNRNPAQAMSVPGMAPYRRWMWAERQRYAHLHALRHAVRHPQPRAREVRSR